jgi:hypothetical protein
VNVVYFFIEKKGLDGNWESVVEEGNRDKDYKPRLWQCERLEEARNKVTELKKYADPCQYRISKRTKKEGSWVNETVEEL